MIIFCIVYSYVYNLTDKRSAVLRTLSDSRAFDVIFSTCWPRVLAKRFNPPTLNADIFVACGNYKKTI